MSTIGGPGGIGGPKGPDGPEGVSDMEEVAAEAPIEQAPIEQARGAAATGDVEALAAEVAAGRLTPHEAIDRLVEAAAGPGLDAAERAELRELLTDLVTNDPHLGALVGRI
jgi:hypothetical protein